MMMMMTTIYYMFMKIVEKEKYIFRVHLRDQVIDSTQSTQHNLLPHFLSPSHRLIHNNYYDFHRPRRMNSSLVLPTPTHTQTITTNNRITPPRATSTTSNNRAMV